MSETTRSWTGWLLPDGSFWPCEPFEHSKESTKIIEYFDYSNTKYSDERFLEVNGFLKITKLRGLCYIMEPEKATFEQLMWFKEKMEIAPTVWSYLSIDAINHELINI